MAKDSGKNKDFSSRQIVNKKAFYNYEIVEKFEAGLALLGTEVKSLRAGQADLDGSYARTRNGQCWLIGVKIAQYAQAGTSGHLPMRDRKLLLHKSQIRKIATKIELRGFTLVPLRIYFNQKNLAKVELALARGKRQYDKRKKMQQRQHKKDIDKSMKRYGKSRKYGRGIQR